MNSRLSASGDSELSSNRYCTRRSRRSLGLSSISEGEEKPQRPQPDTDESQPETDTGAFAMLPLLLFLVMFCFTLIVIFEMLVFWNTWILTK